MSKEKQILAVIFLITLSLISIYDTPSLISPISNNRIAQTIEIGSFYLTNTSENFLLLEKRIYSSYIGTTWNLSIQVDINSSSGINVTLRQSQSRIPKIWEGCPEFQVNPNESRSELYVNHEVSDDLQDINFQYSLLKPSRNASGYYQIEVTHPGYPVDWDLVKTGTYYVANITAWVEKHERQSTTETSDIRTTSDITSLTTSQSTPVSTPGFRIAMTMFIAALIVRKIQQGGSSRARKIRK